MEAVSLFKCRLVSVPGPIFAGWRLLRRLALYENALTQLPPEIGDMQDLQELWVAATVPPFDPRLTVV
jgi:hypothetical protein